MAVPGTWDCGVTWVADGRTGELEGTRVTDGLEVGEQVPGARPRGERNELGVDEMVAYNGRPSGDESMVRATNCAKAGVAAALATEFREQRSIASGEQQFREHRSVARGE